MAKRIKNFKEVMREFASLLSDYRLRRDITEVEIARKMNHYFGENRLVIDLFSKNDVRDLEHGRLKRDAKHVALALTAFEKISGLDLKTLKEAASDISTNTEVSVKRAGGKRNFGFGVDKNEILAAIVEASDRLHIPLKNKADLKAVSHEIRNYFGYSQRALARAIGELTPGGNGKYHSVTYRHLETDDEHRFSIQFKEALVKLLEEKVKSRKFVSVDGIGIAFDKVMDGKAKFTAEIFTHNEDLSRMSPVLWHLEFAAGPASINADPIESLTSIFFGLVKEALLEKREGRTLESIIVPAAHAALEGLKSSGIIEPQEERAKNLKKLEFIVPTIEMEQKLAANQ